MTPKDAIFTGLYWLTDGSTYATEQAHEAVKGVIEELDEAGYVIVAKDMKLFSNGELIASPPGGLDIKAFAAGVRAAQSRLSTKLAFAATEQQP